MKRLWPLLAVILLLITACAKPSEPKPSLKWTGQALEGAKFGVRELNGVTVHYTAPTTPAQAEAIANAADGSVRNQVGWGRLTPGERLAVWVVPEGQAWPTGLAAPPMGRKARAAGPGAVVTTAADAKSAADDGLAEAIAVAATQPAASPVYAVDWLHEGTGAALNAEPFGHPATGFRKAHDRVPAARDLLRALTDSATDESRVRAAALSLATLVMDRWGVAWSTQYPRTTADLTPPAALRWATGVTDEGEAVALWQTRIDAAVAADPRVSFAAMADMSPVRLTPQLAKLPPGPGPNENYSPHTYTIDARYDAGTRTVTGTETLTWTNGEGIGVEALYFNLWPNAEQYAKYGAGIAVRDVTVDGRAAIAAQAQGLDLTVPLGRTVAPGEMVTIGLHFTTRLPGLISPRVLGQSTNPNRFNLAHWFPILAVLDDRGWNLHAFPDFPGEPYSENAAFHVTLDLPAGMVAAATGHRVGRETVGDRWRYEWNAPNFKDFVVAGGRDFALESRSVNGVNVQVLDANQAVATAILDETERALRLFEPQFGKYAYPDLVVVPCCAWVEFPGLFFTETANSDRGNWWHSVLYHELAHQWFYGMVGNDQYSEAWLDEGFARYGERYGLKSFGYKELLRDIAAREIPAQVHVNSSTLQFNIYGGYTAAVYDLGAVLLEDLESRLGPERFRRLLNRWTESYRFKTATTADFVRLATEVAGEDLSEFFRAHKIDLGAREPYRPVMPLGQVRPR